VVRLTLAPFLITYAISTSEVIALLAREPPVAVILDIDLFTLDGPAICRAVNEHETTSVLATMSAPERAPAMIKAGCHGFLLKPFVPNLLAGRMGRLLRERSQQCHLRAAFPAATANRYGTNHTYRDVRCPACETPNAVGFEFASHRREWFACLACHHVWMSRAALLKDAT
jgi:DNA-binding response OmpR family regulator